MTTTSERSRVQPGVPTGGQFAVEARSESAVSLDAVAAVPLLGDLATTQADREVAQDRWRSARTESERNELSTRIEQLSMRVLALDIREQCPEAARVVLVESDQGDFMDVADVLDADGKPVDVGDWGVEDSYTAAADLNAGSSVWGKHAVEVGVRGGERKWALDLNAALGGAPNLPEQQTPAGTLSTFIGDDGVPVVQLDTGTTPGRVRINVNDAPVWDGDPETHYSATATLSDIELALPDPSVTDPDELRAAVATIRTILDRTRA